MTRTVRPNLTSQEGNTDLDMRVSPNTGNELKEEIVHSVKRSQSTLITTLPDRLILTQKQFVSLQDDMQNMDQTEDRLYITPYNAMVCVIDRDIDTVEDIEAIMQNVDEIKKETHDHDATHQPEPQSGK